MKPKRHLKPKPLPVLLVALALCAMGYGAWYISQSGLLSSNCGTNRACFYWAYTNGCPAKTIKVSNTTIEGDPIITTATLSRNGQECNIDAVYDTSQDKYGSGEIYTLECKKLTKKEARLELTGCDENGSLIEI